jgi:hypothetical protein
MSGDIYVGLFWADASKNSHDNNDRTLYLKSVLGTAELSGKFCYPVCWAS